MNAMERAAEVICEYYEWPHPDEDASAIAANQADEGLLVTDEIGDLLNAVVLWRREGRGKNAKHFPSTYPTEYWLALRVDAYLASREQIDE